MTQHVLLIAVAPPLILLARPWATSWRALPRDVRRPTARGLVHADWARPLRAAARLLAAPPVGLAFFCGILFVWHVPALFDATLQSGTVHVVEHVTFLAAGFLFWSQLIDSPPLRGRLGYPARALYAVIPVAAGTAHPPAGARTLGLYAATPISSRARAGSPLSLTSGSPRDHVGAGSIPFVAAALVFSTAGSTMTGLGVPAHLAVGDMTPSPRFEVAGRAHMG